MAWAFIDVDDPGLRMIATMAAVRHLGSAVLADRRPEVVGVLRERVHGGENRAWHVRHLADLDQDVSEYLADEDADVRTTAALAAGMAGRDDANAVIADALARAAATPVKH